MGEPGAVAFGEPAPSNSRRSANNRIKLNRDLMQRLASALGNQAAKWQQQQQPAAAASDSTRRLRAEQPLRARQAKPHDGAEWHEPANSGNNKSLPNWPPINQTRRHSQLDVRPLETCFAPAPTSTSGSSSSRRRRHRHGQQQQAECTGVARPPVYPAEPTGHEALVCASGGSSNCSRGKHCCRHRGRLRWARWRADRASSFCYYANDISASVRASSNSAHTNHNYSTALNNAPDKQSDPDANNRSSAPTIAPQLAGRRPAPAALFLIASPSGPLGAHCLGPWRRRQRSRLGAGSWRALRVAAISRLALPRGRRRILFQPLVRALGGRRAREREKRQDHLDNSQRPDRFYDHNERRKANRKQTVALAGPSGRRAANTRRSEIKPTTVIAANEVGVVRNETTTEGPITTTSELSAESKALGWAPARASGPKQEAVVEWKEAKKKQRAQEAKRAPTLRHDPARPFTQAGPRMAQQLITCDTRHRSTSKQAEQEAARLHALNSSGKLKGVRVRASKPQTFKSLLFWFLFGLWGLLLLLLLRPGAAPIRPLIEPASCLELPSGLASLTTSANNTGSVRWTRPAAAAATDNDEFSRAVMATMSTQSTLASNFTSSERRLLPSARPLVSQSSGGADLDSPITGHDHPPAADDAELTGARTPATLNEFESSDDLILADAGGVSEANSLPAGSSPELSSRPTTSMAQLHAELQQNQKNASLTSGGANPIRPGELEGYFNKFVDFARIFAMVAIMIGDICGNSLVILSVVRHSKLRVTTNWFVVSLACADILVALFAMTFNASVQITGRWIFPRWMCDFWNSCDVLASTASILHLCCISIDRYYAIMRPLDYPMKITTRRVCYALAVVWISSALLSYIPIFTGIYTTSEFVKWQQENPDQCEFVVNRVYAIVSSSISFWIPCCIMVFTYYKIYQEATRQEKFIYKAQSMMPAPQSNHYHHHHNQRSSSNAAPNRSKQQRSKSMAITSLSSSTANSNAKGRKGNAAQIKQFAAKQQAEAAVASSSDALNVSGAPTNAAAGSTTNESNAAAEQQPLTGSALDLNNNNNNNSNNGAAARKQVAIGKGQEAASVAAEDQDERDSNSGQSTPTKRSISKMKREHKAAKTLGIIMGVFILCWLPFFFWYTPMHICGHACDGIVPHNVVTLLFWIGYFNSTLNPIIYAYFNHEFRDAFKKTLQWIFCCCRDLKCLRVHRPNDNQHYNCTYRSTQEIGLVTNG